MLFSTPINKHNSSHSFSTSSSLSSESFSSSKNSFMINNENGVNMSSPLLSEPSSFSFLDKLSNCLRILHINNKSFWNYLNYPSHKFHTLSEHIGRVIAYKILMNPLKFFIYSFFVGCFFIILLVLGYLKGIYVQNSLIINNNTTSSNNSHFTLRSFSLILPFPSLFSFLSNLFSSPFFYSCFSNFLAASEQSIFPFQSQDKNSTFAEKRQLLKELDNTEGEKLMGNQNNAERFWWAFIKWFPFVLKFNNDISIFIPKNSIYSQRKKKVEEIFGEEIPVTSILYFIKKNKKLGSNYNYSDSHKTAVTQKYCESEGSIISNENIKDVEKSKMGSTPVQSSITEVNYAKKRKKYLAVANKKNMNLYDKNSSLFNRIIAGKRINKKNMHNTSNEMRKKINEKYFINSNVEKNDSIYLDEIGERTMLPVPSLSFPISCIHASNCTEKNESADILLFDNLYSIWQNEMYIQKNITIYNTLHDNENNENPKHFFLHTNYQNDSAHKLLFPEDKSNSYTIFETRSGWEELCLPQPVGVTSLIGKPCIVTSIFGIFLLNSEGVFDQKQFNDAYTGLLSSGISLSHLATGYLPVTLYSPVSICHSDDVEGGIWPFKLCKINALQSIYRMKRGNKIKRLKWEEKVSRHIQQIKKSIEKNNYNKLFNAEVKVSNVKEKQLNSEKVKKSILLNDKNDTKVVEKSYNECVRKANNNLRKEKHFFKDVNFYFCLAFFVFTFFSDFLNSLCSFFSRLFFFVFSFLFNISLFFCFPNFLYLASFFSYFWSSTFFLDHFPFTFFYSYLPTSSDSPSPTSSKSSSFFSSSPSWDILHYNQWHVSNESEMTVYRETPLLITTFVLMVLFMSSSISQYNSFPNKLRIFLSFSVIFVTLFSSAFSFVICMIIGIPINPLSLLFMHMLLGIVTDYMIITVKAYDSLNINSKYSKNTAHNLCVSIKQPIYNNTVCYLNMCTSDFAQNSSSITFIKDKNYPLNLLLLQPFEAIRLIESFSKSFSTILLTSITICIAFFSASFIDFPVVTYFCLNVCFGILALFGFYSTFFASFFIIDSTRIQCNKNEFKWYFGSLWWKKFMKSEKKQKKTKDVEIQKEYQEIFTYSHEKCLSKAKDKKHKDKVLFLKKKFHENDFIEDIEEKKMENQENIGENDTINSDEYYCKMKTDSSYENCCYRCNNVCKIEHEESEEWQNTYLEDNNLKYKNTSENDINLNVAKSSVDGLSNKNYFSNEEKNENAFYDLCSNDSISSDIDNITFYSCSTVNDNKTNNNFCINNDTDEKRSCSFENYYCENREKKNELKFYVKHFRNPCRLKLARFCYHKFFRCITILLYASLLIFSWLLIDRIKTNFSLITYLSDDSPLKEYIEKLNEFWLGEMRPIYLVLPNSNIFHYHLYDERKKVMDFVQKLLVDEAIKGPVISWIHDIEAFSNGTNIANIAEHIPSVTGPDCPYIPADSSKPSIPPWNPKEKFYEWVAKWRKLDNAFCVNSSLLSNDTKDSIKNKLPWVHAVIPNMYDDFYIQMNEDNTGIKWSRIMLLSLHNSGNSEVNIKSLNRLNSLVNEHLNISNAFLYSEWFAEADRDENIFRVLLAQMLQVALGITIVLCFLLPSLFGFFVVFLIFTIDLLILGFMAIFNVAIDSFSVVVMIMSVSFSVEYTAKICYYYAFCNYSHANKFILSIADVGIDTLFGAISTFLGVFLLIFAKSYGFRLFVLITSAVLIISALTNLFITPTLLLFFNKILTSIFFSNKF